MTSSLIGRTLGSYRVIDKLGQGGMATVYIGYQEAVDRKVAIKVLPPHPGMNTGFAERFQLEAKTIARLQHPHILPLYDYGQEDDILYLVMAYIDGGSLEERLRRGAMPLRDVEKILREVAGALDYAHRQGVIHRDIKPANILLSGEGFALLADFGIVKLVEGSADLTGTGVVGTPAYMSPEQAQGGVIDSRADIYSLGVVIYQMITGKQPFSAPSPMQLMLKVIQDPPPNILSVYPELPEELGAVMDQVLAKDPNNRFQSAAEFAEAFSGAIHSTEELKAVKATMPLEPGITPPHPMTRPGSGESTTQPRASTGSGDTGTGQTIVVQQAMNPLVMLAGIAIIAAALIIAVLLVVNGDDDSTNGGAIAASTQAAAVNTQAEVVDETNPDGQASGEEAATGVATVQTVPSFGRVIFGQSDAPGDTVTVRADGVSAAGGSSYVAWLTGDDVDPLRLGELVVDGFGSGALTFTDPEGRMLPALYNVLLVTREADADTTTPADDVAYSGYVPPAVNSAISAILIASEDGLNGGSLLDGARTEVRIASQHAGLAARASNVSGVRLHAEHTINILRGTEDDFDGNGRPENPGRGVGVFAFVDQMETLLLDAASAEGAPATAVTDAEVVRVCLENARVRAERIIELEQAMIAAETVEAAQEPAVEATGIVDEITGGFDLNENGQIEPFEGECGLDQIETFIMLVASMPLQEGAPGDASEG
ncbi:MAG: serine/threonine-protein kinase [Chloroflexota bacterium]